jgi:hypothetical protein
MPTAQTASPITIEYVRVVRPDSGLMEEPYELLHGSWIEVRRPSGTTTWMDAAKPLPQGAVVVRSAGVMCWLAMPFSPIRIGGFTTREDFMTYIKELGGRVLSARVD